MFQSKVSTYKFLLEVIWVNESILGTEEDVLYELLVWQWRHLVEGVGCVMLHEHRVNTTRVHPLWFCYTAPTTASPFATVHWYIGLSVDSDTVEIVRMRMSIKVMIVGTRRMHLRTFSVPPPPNILHVSFWFWWNVEISVKRREKQPGGYFESRSL